MAQNVTLPVNSPGTWLDAGCEALLGISLQQAEEAQMAVLRRRFDELGGSVAALERLARRQGITRIDSLEEALPLFFDHGVFKNYPLSLIENRDFPKLTSWLDRLTSHDLSKLDLTDLKMVDEWLQRLEQSGMLVTHSTGTTGKLSFIPRSMTEFPALRASYYESAKATTGVDLRVDHVESFFPGYRGGYQMMLKMISMFDIPGAGGPEHFHSLYQNHVSADLMSLAGRIQAAEERGELADLDLDPALLEARKSLVAQAMRREQDVEVWFFKLFDEFRGCRVKLGGTFSDLIRTARSGIDKGLKPEFAPGSFIMTGGGMKGLKDPPPDWEGYVRDYFGIDTIGMVYGMSESIGMNPRCRAGNFHIMAHTIPLQFDADMNMLPRKGEQTGRYAFFDLLAETYWGGFITGDRVTIHWDGDCPCGWKSPCIGPEIQRFSELEGGDDKVSCAGTVQAYNDFMDYVAQG